jgi:uncharacterized protein (DUF952 family)
MKTILHITQRQRWEEAKLVGSYRAESLETEGFIHCSLPQQFVKTANRFFANQKDLVILCIDSDRVTGEIRYEGEKELFPHIYDALNVNAVFKEVDLNPGNDGMFEMPQEIKDLM